MKAEIRFTSLSVEKCLEVVKCLLNENTEATIMVQEKSLIKENIKNFYDVSEVITSTFDITESIKMIPDGSIPEKAVTKSNVVATKDRANNKGKVKQKRERLSHQDIEFQYSLITSLFSDTVSKIRNSNNSSDFAEVFAQDVLGFDKDKDRCYNNVVIVLQKMQYFVGTITHSSVIETCGVESYKNFQYAIKSHFVKRNEEIKQKARVFSPLVIIQYFNVEFNPSKTESTS